jgi:fructose-1,6-bisphosphatase/inositol monophosphatase family enzyme
LAKESPSWTQEDIEEEFWRFVDQKFKDYLNMAAVDSIVSDASQQAKQLAIEELQKPTTEDKVVIE